MVLGIAYGLVVIFGLLGVVRHPGWALFGYYVAAFMRPNEMDWTLFGARLSMPLVAAALLGAIVYFLRHGYPKAQSTQTKLLVVMLLHFWISALVLESSMGPMMGHSRPVDSGSLWAKFDIYRNTFIVALIASRVLNTEVWIHRALVAFGFSGGFLGIWANYHYFVLQTYPITGPGPHIGLHIGVFVDRNDFCMMLSISILVCWYLAAYTKRWWLRMAWLGCMPFLLHTVLLTESRGGLLGVATALMYVTWRSRHRKLLIFANVIGLAVVAAYFTNAALMERYGSIGNYEEDPSALSRLNTWTVGWRIMWGNPLFGVGLENFLEVFYDYSDWKPVWIQTEYGAWEILRDFDFERYQAHQAHNMWIQRGGETGVVGLIILIWFVASIPFDTHRVRRWITELRNRNALDADGYQRAITLNNCVEGMLVPYLTTGFFLSMEDFEGLYLIGTLTACMTNWSRDLRTKMLAAAPAPTTPAAATAMQAPSRYKGTR